MDVGAKPTLDEVEDLVGIGTWTWQPDDDRVAWSDGLATLLALDRDAAPVMRTIEDRIAAPDRASFRAHVADLVASGTDLVGDYRTDCHGRPGWVQCRARVIDGRIVGVFRDVTFERMFLDELTEVAVRDALTGLLNRFAITDRLEHALDRLRRHDRQVAVMFVDLDGLKAVNDAHGHRRGDDVLRAVASRLLDAVRHEDSVGRYGGDEFVIVCEDIDAPEQAMAIAHRIVEHLRLDPTERGLGVEVTTSVGVTAAASGDTAAIVLARADDAMYEAKRDGGGRVVFRQ